MYYVQAYYIHAIKIEKNQCWVVLYFDEELVLNKKCKLCVGSGSTHNWNHESGSEFECLKKISISVQKIRLSSDQVLPRLNWNHHQLTFGYSLVNPQLESLLFKNIYNLSSSFNRTRNPIPGLVL
jgi:hypothetical protein